MSLADIVHEERHPLPLLLPPLAVRHLEHLLVDGRRARELDDADGARLAHPVAAVHRLLVGGGVEVGVVGDHRVRRRQVDPQPARARESAESC